MKPEESSPRRRDASLKHCPLSVFMQDLLRTLNLILIRLFIHQSITAKELDSLRLNI